MGYIAYGYGTLVLRKGTPKELIEKIGDEFMDVSVSGMENSIEVIVNNSDNFRSDEALEMLTELDPYTISGNIDMTGEDECRWRYRFVKEYGKWAEENCVRLYEEYSEDKDGSPSYKVPVWAVMRMFSQNEYTEPHYYEAAQDAGEIVCTCRDIDSANHVAEQMRNNEDENASVYYTVVETYLKI